MKAHLSAVITLDVVNSSGMSHQDLEVFSLGSEDLIKFTFIDQVEMYRGDGLQSLCKDAKLALKATIAQFCFFKLKAISVRQAIGIGTIANLQDSLAKSNGVAFQLSGREVGNMKKENLLIAIKFENQTLNNEWFVHATVLTDLFENWSFAQIEAVLPSLLNETQSEIAERLGISQAAVNQRLKSAKFHLLQRILHRYSQLF